MEYTVVLHPDPETGGYGVEVPALPGMVTQGSTYEEALEMAVDAIRVHLPLEPGDPGHGDQLEMAVDAIRVHLAGLRQDGEPIPPDVQPRLATVQVAA